MGLKDLRLTKGLTVQQLADKSGVHPMKIYQIEAGKINPANMALRNALRLAEALECDPKALMEPPAEPTSENA